MNEEQIQHMVNRFLAWRLPNDFQPDAGISFKKIEHPTVDMQPVGTNLLTATQAEAMVRHMLDGLSEEQQRTWWVTNHDAPEDNQRVAGPFTTQDDASICRAQIERLMQHNNYWLEQMPEADS